MTPPDPQQVAEIAGRLSKAQREVLLAIRPGEERRSAGCFSANSANSLISQIRPGGALLTRILTANSFVAWYRLTFAGEAVRNFIQGNSHD